MKPIKKLPYEIWEMIIILLIKDKQYHSLNECRKIPLFKQIIYDNKKLYVKKFLRTRLSHKYDFSDFWISKTLDLVTVPTKLLKLGDVYFKYVNTDNDNTVYHKTIHNSSFVGDILSNIIFIGKNIQKIKIRINGNLIMTRYYLKAGMINLKLFDCGLILHLMQHSTIDIEIYALAVEKIYFKVLYLQAEDRSRLKRLSIYTFQSNEYFSNFKCPIRKNILGYFAGLALPLYST